MSEEESAYAAAMEVIEGVPPIAWISCQKCGWRQHVWSYGQTVREQVDVEATLIIAILRFRQQIEEQRAETGATQGLGHETVARAEAAAAAAVGEDHQPARAGRQAEVTPMRHAIERDVDLALDRLAAHGQIISIRCLSNATTSTSLTWGKES